MGMAAILFNGAEPFEHIVNTLSIQTSSCCYRASFCSNRPKVCEEMSKIDFQDGGCGSHLEFLNNSAILCLLGAPMLLIKFQFFFFFFFDLGFTALSRIFHLYRADRSSKVGENRRTRRKTTWPSVSRTWLSHIWPERGSNHSGEKPNGLRVNSLIH